MNSRQTIFYICSVFSLVLFIQGIYMLLFPEGEHKVPEFGGQYSPLQIIRKNINQGDDRNNSNRSITNLLVIGLDENEMRSDVLFLVNHNGKEGKANILSVARDTRIKVNGRFMKINALVGEFGEKAIIEAIEDMTDLNIDYYISLNFKGFRELVDVLGGVEMEIPFDMDYDDPYQNLHIHLKKGKQLLNGEKAEEFVRYRKGNNGEGYEDGDIGRIKMQQQFISQFVEQKFRLKYLLKADDVFHILKASINTNIEIGDIHRIFKEPKNFKMPEVKSYILPGYPEYIEDQWYYICNKKETRSLVKEKFYKE
ncbi:MAG: LytR family transcriptional regulator [Clostridium sp.]|nr:LytR family transcriptional regulator [Clostridium sp.]